MKTSGTRRRRQNRSARVASWSWWRWRATEADRGRARGGRPLVVQPERRRRARCQSQAAVKRVVAVPDAPARTRPDPRRGETGRARRGQDPPASVLTESRPRLKSPGPGKRAVRCARSRSPTSVADRFGADADAVAGLRYRPAPGIPMSAVVEIVESRALAGKPAGRLRRRGGSRSGCRRRTRRRPTRRYPVIYWLPGYAGTGEMLFSGTPGSRVWGTGSTGWCAGAMGEAIVVAPDGFTRWGGAQYLDSPAIGELRDAHRARGDPGDRRALPHGRDARGARDRRQVVGRLRRAGAGHAQPGAVRGRREPRGRHVLRAVGAAGPPGRGPHAAPPRRHRRFPAPVRRAGAEGRRRLHDHHGAGQAGAYSPERDAPARRRAAVRSRHRRDRLGRLAALEGLGPRRDGRRRTPRRCGGCG